MISASELDGLLVVLKKHDANVLRYKNGIEEIELIVPGSSPAAGEMTADTTSTSAKLKLIGFQQDEDDEE
jgi:hypothetical protein